MAARAKTLLLLLAALCLPAFAHVPRPSLVAQKPHQGVERFAQPSHRGPGDANALTAPGLPGCLYDKGRRSRSTAKERDDESGLDYFGARYFGSSLGRFTSADAPFADQHASAPQSWNLYGYVRNNPLKFVDDDGRELRIAIFNSSSQSQQTAARAGQRIATLYRDAGVKNVTVEVTNAAPGSLDRVGALAASVKGGLGFGQHSATLEFRDSAESTGGIMTGQSIPAGNAGHFRDGQAMVNVNAVPVANTDPNFVGPPDPAVALSNTGAHEVAHNALQGHATGEKDPTNIMFPKATAPVINRPDLRFNESQAEVLRKRFNREDEVEGQ